MEAKDTSSSSPSNLHPPSNYDEIFMQRSLLFADSLKDLRTIRTQLYSAAEFFEDSYHGNDHDQLLFESLKDYVSKALISTIDHLGSVTSKVDSFLNENVDEVFETNLGVLCMEQSIISDLSPTANITTKMFILVQPRLSHPSPEGHRTPLIFSARSSDASSTNHQQLTQAPIQ
ncbi:hypothetical protein Ccrd_002632 [Cynara cardunculus var. scolymus]|uniref:ABI family n=1 Tax=Cynara cardunculus var. scolymus TaxID=59895 RepID=A0A103XR09_CYNCS|nr:hypothetical protein Ccrd_002632 [Cynara cardunculus var. scolymus]